MGVEGGFVLVREGVELAGEAVAEGVDPAAFFAVRGFGAGGFLGVLLVAASCAAEMGVSSVDGVIKSVLMSEE